ncbi:MAG: PQQ-binding-like beta-propeller repeat protein, partial [Opitutaceae bacterium]
KEISTSTPPPNSSFRLTINDSIWQVPAGGSITSAPVVGTDRGVYVGSTDTNFLGVNADGSRRWPALAIGGSMDTTAATLAPDGTLYFGAGPVTTGTGKLYAYNSASGAKKWDIVVGTGANASNAAALGSDGTLYLHTSEGRLFAFADEGAAARLKWSVAIPGTSYASATIAPDGTVYLGSDDDTTGHLLYAINPDGTRKWTFRPDNAIYTAVALDAAGNLYFGTLNSGRLYSLTPGGAQRWVYAGASLGTSSSPALSPDSATVYFGGYDSKFHAVNTATGTAQWTFPLGKEVRASSPAVDANGVIYIGCYDGLVYALNPDGSLKRTWATADIIRSSPAIAGTTLYVGSNDHKLYAFDIGAGPANGPWPQYRHNARRTGRAQTEAFAILAGPQAQVALLGLPLTLTVDVSGIGPFTYQWRKNDTAIAGATASSYQVTAVTAATAGSYTVTVTGPEGTLTSAPASVTVESPVPGRLTNLSVRTSAGTGAQTLTMGFVIAGAPDAAVLLRGIGPSLASFGVTGALADPQLQLFSGTTSIAINDNWGGGALAADFTAAGAFPLEATSRDAAMVRTLPAGSYSAQVTGAGQSGIALAELYDRSSGAGARLINVSARAQVGTGGGILIAGFSISGNVPKKILIRAIGPALAAFGVTATLTNPRVDVYRGSTLLQSNDDWNGTVALTNAFIQVGAFTIANATSRDAALLVTLDPGTYTAQVSGVGNTTGVGLVEIYEMP